MNHFLWMVFKRCSQRNITYYYKVSDHGLTSLSKNMISDNRAIKLRGLDNFKFLKKLNKNLTSDKLDSL